MTYKMFCVNIMKYVSYLRLSKKRTDGKYLGVDVQKKIIARYIKESDEILSEFIEIETGTSKKRRVEIYRAIALCKDTKATLIVAKLDRLARDVAFTSSVMKSGINIVFCDFPDANKMVITIMSAVAEYEANLISERTKAALTIINDKIASGKEHISKSGKVVTQLGNHKPGWNKNGNAASIKVRQENKKYSANTTLKGQIHLMYNGGTIFRKIADSLNESGYRSSYGKRFTTDTVCRIYYE